MYTQLILPVLSYQRTASLQWIFPVPEECKRHTGIWILRSTDVWQSRDLSSLSKLHLDLKLLCDWLARLPISRYEQTVLKLLSSQRRQQSNLIQSYDLRQGTGDKVSVAIIHNDGRCVPRCTECHSESTMFMTGEIGTIHRSHKRRSGQN